MHPLFAVTCNNTKIFSLFLVVIKDTAFCTIIIHFSQGEKITLKKGVQMVTDMAFENKNKAIHN